jgi:hypothetical protein
MSEDCYDPFLAVKELEEADERAFHQPRRRSCLAGYIACGTLWGSTIL